MEIEGFVNIISYALSAVIGLIAGFFANGLWDKYQANKYNKHLKNLCCLWFEDFSNINGKGFSLGSLYWSKNDRKFHYDGTRFNMEGDPVYHWKSRSLFFDEKVKLIYSRQSRELIWLRPQRAFIAPKALTSPG